MQEQVIEGAVFKEWARYLKEGAMSDDNVRGLSRAKNNLEGSDADSQAKEYLHEIHHQVKNNLQVVCSLLRIQGRGLLDPEAREVFRRSEERIQCMALVYDKLYNVDDGSSVPFHEYLRDLMQQLAMGARKNGYCPQIQVKSEKIDLSSKIATNLGLLVNEVVANHLRRLMEYGGEQKIEIVLSQSIEAVTIEVFGAALRDKSFVIENKVDKQILDALVRQLSGSIEYSVSASVPVRLIIPKISLGLTKVK